MTNKQRWIAETAKEFVNSGAADTVTHATEMAEEILLLAEEVEEEVKFVRAPLSALHELVLVLVAIIIVSIVVELVRRS